MNIILFEENERFFSASDERCIHIRKVLKKKKGDSFEAGIIGGFAGRAVIEEEGREGISFSFFPETPPEPLFPLRLLVGFPRPIQLKRLLRALSSLGASAVLLCGTDLGEKSYMRSSLVERGAVRAAAVDGAMQAGFSALPSIEIAKTVDAALSIIKEAFPAATKVLLDTAGKDGVLPPVLGSSAGGLLGADGAYSGSVDAEKPLFLAIGSERGWTERERGLFASFGWERRSLGRRILRTETAACAACAVALSALGFWS